MGEREWGGPGKEKGNRMREGRNWSAGAYWGPSGQSAGATLRGHTCVTYSWFVVADDRAIWLP